MQRNPSANTILKKKRGARVAQPGRCPAPARIMTPRLNFFTTEASTGVRLPTHSPRRASSRPLKCLDASNKKCEPPVEGKRTPFQLERILAQQRTLPPWPGVGTDLTSPSGSRGAHAQPGDTRGLTRPPPWSSLCGGRCRPRRRPPGLPHPPQV